MRCTLCTSRPITVCTRCARPFCLEHQPPAEMRCNACEVEYVAQTEGIRYGLWNLLGASIPVVIVALVWTHLPRGLQGGVWVRAITTGSAHLDVLIMGGFAAWLLARGAAGVRAYIARSGFLRERPTND